jgi:hypothetical protein
MREQPAPTTGRRLAPRRHYVYAWYANDEVIYIGVGTGGRAWAKHRPIDWTQFDESEVSIEILRDNLSKPLAYRIAADLIYLVRPFFNTPTKKKIRKSHFQRRVEREKREFFNPRSQYVHQ